MTLISGNIFKPNREFTILVVDDFPANILALEATLAEEGYTTQSAANGYLALDKVAQTLPDLILLDIQMPGIDGFEVCRQLKKDERTHAIPVIFLTAMTQTSDIIKGFACGAQDFVTKPFRPAELIARVETHLRLNEALAQIKEKNQVLSMQNRQLEELNSTKDRMFSIIGHDLRGPIGSLRMMLDMILENPEEYSMQDILDVIQPLRDSAASSYSLLENLLSWARCQHGEIEYSPGENDLSDAINNTFSLLTPAVHQKRIILEKQLPLNTLAWFDKEMITTVLRNLVNNAIKFSKPGGKIIVKVHETKDQFITIKVQDQGIGIKPENMEKLFRTDLFFSTFGTASEKGSGLGLILCKEFVEINGGKIWVESIPGAGSTFFFTLPFRSSL